MEETGERMDWGMGGRPDVNVVVVLDGRSVAGPMSENEAFMWLLDHQPHSVMHALRYEGWQIVEVGEDGS